MWAWFSIHRSNMSVDGNMFKPRVQRSALCIEHGKSPKAYLAPAGRYVYSKHGRTIPQAPAGRYVSHWIDARQITCDHPVQM